MPNRRATSDRIIESALDRFAVFVVDEDGALSEKTENAEPMHIVTDE